MLEDFIKWVGRVGFQITLQKGAEASYSRLEQRYGSKRMERLLVWFFLLLIFYFAVYASMGFFAGVALAAVTAKVLQILSRWLFARLDAIKPVPVYTFMDDGSAIIASPSSLQKKAHSILWVMGGLVPFSVLMTISLVICGSSVYYAVLSTIGFWQVLVAYLAAFALMFLIPGVPVFAVGKLLVMLGLDRCSTFFLWSAFVLSVGVTVFMPSYLTPYGMWVASFVTKPVQSWSPAQAWKKQPVGIYHFGA